MPNKKHELNALIEVDPKAASKRILAALRSTGMHRKKAAEQLGCTDGTLLRWIQRLNLGEEIEKLTNLSKKRGWFHGKRGGRPKGTTIENGAKSPNRKKKKRRSPGLTRS